jgi:hypothetical protein
MHSKTAGHFIAMTLAMMLLPFAARAELSVGISVNVAPPELPVYVQPPIPAEGYIWTPGYWAWNPEYQDYYWVPGTWVMAPQVGFLWTPGYWGVVNGLFLWNAGYWGPHVGFYGGVNYGYGYGGRGYEGGYWQGGHMYYNREVVNVGNTHITNVYNKTVVNNVTVNRVSYNGGSGGVRAQPTASEVAATRDHHIQPTPVQQQHVQAAGSNQALRASVNKGAPPIPATSRAGDLSTGVAQRPNPRTPPKETQTNAPPATAMHTLTPRPVTQEHTNPPHQAAPVEPYRQPAQTQQPRPVQQPHPVQQPQVQQQPHPVQQPQVQQQPHQVQQQPRPVQQPQAQQQPRPVQQQRPVQQPAEHPPEHQGEHDHR